jgi:hypothetical protein
VALLSQVWVEVHVVHDHAFLWCLCPQRLENSLERGCYTAVSWKPWSVGGSTYFLDSDESLWLKRTDSQERGTS